MWTGRTADRHSAGEKGLCFIFIIIILYIYIRRPPSSSAHHYGLMHVHIVLCIIRYIHVCCRVYRKMAMSEIDILVIILICIQNYTCINYTVFFRFLSSELTYDNYCTCHSLINCIYQDILLLTVFFSVTLRAIVIFYFRFRSSNNCYYFFLCNVVC